MTKAPGFANANYESNPRGYSDTSSRHGNILARSQDFLKFFDKIMFENYLNVLSHQSLSEFLKCDDPTCINICDSYIKRESAIVNNITKSC